MADEIIIKEANGSYCKKKVNGLEVIRQGINSDEIIDVLIQKGVLKLEDFAALKIK